MTDAIQQEINASIDHLSHRLFDNSDRRLFSLVVALLKARCYPQTEPIDVVWDGKLEEPQDVPCDVLRPATVAQESHTDDVQKRQQEVAKLYQSGHDSREIARMVGVSKTRVLHDLEEQGIPRRSRSESVKLVNEKRRGNALAQIRDDQVARLYTQDQLTYREIAERLGTNTHEVGKALKRMGISARPNSVRVKMAADRDRAAQSERTSPSSNIAQPSQSQATKQPSGGVDFLIRRIIDDPKEHYMVSSGSPTITAPLGKTLTIERAVIDHRHHEPEVVADPPVEWPLDLQENEGSAAIVFSVLCALSAQGTTPKAMELIGQKFKVPVQTVELIRTKFSRQLDRLMNPSTVQDGECYRIRLVGQLGTAYQNRRTVCQ